MVHKDRVDNALPVSAHRQKLLELEPELSSFLSLHLDNKKLKGQSHESAKMNRPAVYSRVSKHNGTVQGQSFKKGERKISREINT
jgi:hypothetical protein